MWTAETVKVEKWTYTTYVITVVKEVWFANWVVWNRIVSIFSLSGGERIAINLSATMESIKKWIEDLVGESLFVYIHIHIYCQSDVYFATLSRVWSMRRRNVTRLCCRRTLFSKTIKSHNCVFHTLQQMTRSGFAFNAAICLRRECRVRDVRKWHWMRRKESEYNGKRASLLDGLPSGKASSERKRL